VLAITGVANLDAQPVKIEADELGGVVSSYKGPEAGLWVIAETRRSAGGLDIRIE
jgi:hypothetical protein